MNLRTLFPAIATALLLSPFAVSALTPALEIPNKPTEQLKKSATHIAVVETARVYSMKERVNSFEIERYVAELKVVELEKGEGIAKDEPLYVRWFTQHWVGSGLGPTGSSGHYGWTPKAGEKARVYLAKNAYDGYSPDNKDGGFNVFVPNGFEKLKK